MAKTSNGGSISAGNRENFKRDFVNAIRYVVKDSLQTIAKDRLEIDYPAELRIKLENTDKLIDSIRRRKSDIEKDVANALSGPLSSDAKKEIEENSKDLKALLQRLSDDLIKQSADFGKGLQVTGDEKKNTPFKTWKSYIDQLKEYLEVVSRLKSE